MGGSGMVPGSSNKRRRGTLATAFPSDGFERKTGAGTSIRGARQSRLGPPTPLGNRGCAALAKRPDGSRFDGSRFDGSMCKALSGCACGASNISGHNEAAQYGSFSYVNVAERSTAAAAGETSVLA